METLGPLDSEDRCTTFDNVPVQRTHCVTIARRIVLAGLLALGCVVVIGVVIAVVEIAGDLLRSGRLPS